jgi:hypothetical protein
VRVRHVNFSIQLVIEPSPVVVQTAKHRSLGDSVAGRQFISMAACRNCSLIRWRIGVSRRDPVSRAQSGMWSCGDCNRSELSNDALEVSFIYRDQIIIRDNLDLGRPERVQLIFDRRVTKKTRGQFRRLPCKGPLRRYTSCAGINRHVGVSSEGWRVQWGIVPPG